MSKSKSKQEADDYGKRLQNMLIKYAIAFAVMAIIGVILDYIGFFRLFG